MNGKCIYISHIHTHINKQGFHTLTQKPPNKQLFLTAVWLCLAKLTRDMWSDQSIEEKIVSISSTLPGNVAME